MRVHHCCLSLFNSHTLRAVLREGVVWLSCDAGIADGITLMSRRGEEAEFYVLTEDESCPVVDDRPNLIAGRPEVRRYRAILRYGTRDVCRFSSVVEVTVP